MQFRYSSILRAIFAATILVSTCATAVASGRTQPDDEFSTGFRDPVVAFINDEIRRTWEDNAVEPSEIADDAEWLRRVSLDLAGHIPTAVEVDSFLRDPGDEKRANAIERLLNDPDYVQNWTTVWANLLIGRRTPQRTSRESLEKFLREAFSRNRPWNEVVYDLLTAEGHYEEQGAANFLLAHLDGNPNREDYTVEATARATRLFLGMQIQCTQCHNHPFNDWKQTQFWEFDSFFKQIRRVDHWKTDPTTGRRTDDYSELVWRNFSGPVYFEKRSGVMEVAYPRYEEHEADSGPSADRRKALAELMAREDAEQLLARAMVNRMWAHFFGHGFTRPVDDMGPHNPPTHPALLERLTQEFAASEYDLQQLMRWIANSEAYQLTSRFGDGNRMDNPAAGEVALFSRVYMKPMTAEQLYESLVIATGAENAGEGDYQQAEEARRQWMREFLLTFGGNAEDEPTLFSGSIPQALMMMNGRLVRESAKPGGAGTLYAVYSSDQLQNDAQRVRALYLATLSRNPSRREGAAAHKLIRANNDKWIAYQDLYWALLNSNEFVMNH